MNRTEKLRELLNREHKQYGYGVSAMARLLSEEYGFKLNLEYKMAYIDTASSTIELYGNSITMDELRDDLFATGVIEKKFVEIPCDDGKIYKTRKWFTTDYEGYQKNKKRREAIDKVLNSQ